MKSKIAMAAATTAGGPNLEDVLVAGDGGNGDDIDVFNLEILLGVDRTAAVGDSTDVIEAVEIPTDAGYQYIHSTAVDASGGDGGGGDGGGGDAMVGGQPVTGSREFATVKWMSPEQQAALKVRCLCWGLSPMWEVTFSDFVSGLDLQPSPALTLSLGCRFASPLPLPTPCSASV